MTFEKLIFQVSHGMSAMAATHENDTISNALASLSDRLVSMKDKRDLATLSDTDKALLAYYNANKR